MKIKPYFVEVETLDEYLDVCRHWKYYREKCGAKDDIHIWYITEYNLKPEDLNRWEVKKMFKRRPDILKMAKYHVGDLCKVHNTVGIFRGVQVTDEDYYWMVEKLNGEKYYCTCVDECKPYNTYKIFDNSVKLNTPIRIKTRATTTAPEIKLSGELVEKDGGIFFQAKSGLCIPTSEIAMYCYIPKR